MRPRSLRLRMMGLALIWVVLSLLGAALALQFLFTLNIERTARAEMAAALNRLAAEIVPEVATPAIGTPLPDPLYSTPFSGRYWQIEALDNGGVTRSKSLWDFVLPTPPVATGGELLHHAEGPEQQPLILLTRRLELETSTGERPFLVTIGADRSALDAAKVEFAWDAAKVLALLGAIIVLAAWVHIKLGLAPVQSVRRGVEAIRRGEVERLEGPYPSELEPLIDEVNELLATRDAATEKARSRASDLAHGLKTPLAALTGVAERLRNRGNPADADMIESLTEEMAERMDYQLRLASLRVRTAAHAASASLNTAVIRTMTVLKKTGHGEHLHWVAQLGDDCDVDMHRQDLLELVGITLENAAKWAHSRVSVHSRRDGGFAVLEIGDDGPGIPPEQIAQLGIRGRRLDESRPGTGLGLAMAAQILDLNGGSMQFGRADAGGLCVTLRMPLSLARRRAGP
ncbi:MULTISPECIES: HAMP domain-containing sensor histidine kinase [unclassified Devosia]|uniref:ATP-binding protein n=1 Tax=unclassified Devosia TaxID=196773 RepID=UPI0015546F55